MYVYIYIYIYTYSLSLYIYIYTHVSVYTTLRILRQLTVSDGDQYVKAGI